MHKRKMLLLACAAVLALACIVTVLALLLKHEPSFYRRAVVAAGPDRKDMSAKCFGQFIALGNNMIEPPRGPWEVTFSMAQLNSFFEEEFVRLGEAESLR